MNANEQDISKTIANHDEVASRERARFLSEMVGKALPEAKVTYELAAERVVDKELLKFGTEISKLIAIARVKDVRNCREDLFHIYPPLRDIWTNIEKFAVGKPE